MLGLFAFTYLSLHFLNWLVLDQWFDLGAIAADIARRPYITVGFTAYALLVPLAVTSTPGGCADSVGAGTACTGWCTRQRSSAAPTSGGR